MDARIAAAVFCKKPSAWLSLWIGSQAHLLPERRLTACCTGPFFWLALPRGSFPPGTRGSRRGSWAGAGHFAPCLALTWEPRETGPDQGASSGVWKAPPTHLASQTRAVSGLHLSPIFTFPLGTMEDLLPVSWHVSRDLSRGQHLQTQQRVFKFSFKRI